MFTNARRAPVEGVTRRAGNPRFTFAPAAEQVRQRSISNRTMKTRNDIEGSHRGKGPLKRQRIVPKEDSSETDTSSNNETDQDGDPDYNIGQKPPRQKRKRIRKASPHPDDLPDLEPSDTESQPRTRRNYQVGGSTRKNLIDSDSDAEPDSQGDVSQQVSQRRTTRKKKRCQRQNQLESSDSDEPAQPESPGGISSPEEPPRTPSNRGNDQIPQPRTSVRIRSRQNRKFHKPTRQDVFDGIAESAGRPRRPIRMKAAASFTRETHFYNRDNLSESETSSVDEYVTGKFTVEVPREEVQEEEVEESQEHLHRRLNLASDQRRWDIEREYLEHRQWDLERRHHTTTDESSSSSSDDDLQPLPQEAYRVNDDGIPQDPVINAPHIAAPHLPAVAMPIQQAPFVCPYDDDEDDSMYGVEDAQVNRPMANRVNYGFGPAAIETDEELEALMLAMDDTAPVVPGDMVEGRRVPAGNVDQQVSDDEGSIIIVSDSEEDDLSIPVPPPNRSVQDIRVAGPSRSDIDEMLAIPSCSKDYPGPVQPDMRSSHQESHNRGQVNVFIEPLEARSMQDDGHEMADSHLDAPAEQVVQVSQVDHEEMPRESSHGCLQVQDAGDHCSKDDGRSAQDDMDAVPDERPIPMMIGGDVYNNTPVQVQASPNSNAESDQSVPLAGSGYPGHVPMEEETEGGTATETTSTAASISSQIPFRRRLFTSTTEDEIPTTTSRQEKENTGAVNLEQLSGQSFYISESLESEERNLGENGESEDTDDNGNAVEITPVCRKSFRLIVSEDEEEEPAPSDEPNYSRRPVTDCDDETADDSNEGSADSDQKSATEYDEEEGARSRSGSEDDEDDEDDDARRRSKRAQLVTPQKRQYLESMARYKMSRERKKSK